MATETRPVGDRAPEAARRAPAGTPPRLAEGVELLGRFEDSGFEDPPYLARRSDGQVIQLTRLLHLVAAAADGTRDEAAMADEVSEQFGRRVSADNIRFLADRKLRPLGVLARADGSSPRLRKADPLLALRYRTALVPTAAVARLAGAFRWLYSPVVLVAALGALVAFDGWLLAVHGVAGGLRSTLYEPVLLLGMFGAVVVATAWHEVGHATACRYGGARPGVLGAGVYLVWPAFYCDVTDAYRLSRRGRLRTDLGGVYFNGLFALATAGAYLATGFEPLLLVVLSQHLIVLQQLIPLLRFDGYYVLSDLTGVPDILSRVGPILRSLVPGRERSPRVTELKPWVRRVVVAYVVLLVPVLLAMLVVTVIGAPRVFATAYDSLGLQLDRIGAAADRGAIAVVPLVGLQIAALVLPCLALVLTATRLGRRLAGALVRWARGSAGRSAAAVGAVLLLGGLAAWTWWPNGDYEPIRPGERGTLSDAVRSVGGIPAGRPSWTPATDARYGEQATVRERRAAARERERERDRDPSSSRDSGRSTRERRSTSTTPRPAAGEPSGRDSTTPSSGGGGAPGAAGPSSDAGSSPAPAGGASAPAPAPAPGGSPSTPAAEQPAAEQPASEQPAQDGPTDQPPTATAPPATTPATTTPSTTATQPPPP